MWLAAWILLFLPTVLMLLNRMVLILVLLRPRVRLKMSPFDAESANRSSLLVTVAPRLETRVTLLFILAMIDVLRLLIAVPTRDSRLCSACTTILESTPLVTSYYP